jgi:hypothetical protein
LNELFCESISKGIVRLLGRSKRSGFSNISDRDGFIEETDCSSVDQNGVGVQDCLTGKLVFANR